MYGRLRNILIAISIVFFAGPSLLTCGQDKTSDQVSGRIDFEKQIRPLLLKHCADCHGPKNQESSLRLDAKLFAFKGGDGGKVILPGNPGGSELINRIESDDEDLKMPPDSELTRREKTLLRNWIKQGASWPESQYDRTAVKDPRLKHWAFQPVQKIEPPKEYNHANPIDRFIARQHKRNGLEFSPVADKRTLIRRLTLDLTGLPPQPEEIRIFMNDNSDAAYEKLVGRLLKSPRFGERWAQHWLDVVRYADTHGFEVNTSRENSWPYRDYVIEAFNNDKPYDTFVKEQIAGDAMQNDAATGFLVASAVLLPGQIGADAESKRLARQDELDEMVVGTGATFLGLSIGCARCHDHKFDPISAKDYYAMQAFFAGVDFGERELKDADYSKRLAAAQQLKPKISQLRRELESWIPQSTTDQFLLIDEADKKRTKFLYKENGIGKNPTGTKRGYLSDVGSASRTPNLSGGQYTWWNNVPGRDVMVYQPGVSGNYRLWISWGAHGSGVHTRDARYLVDHDGKLETTNDQRELIQVDQYYPAYVSDGETEKRPLWSGFKDAGTVTLNPDSVILLRGGKTGSGITADVIALQSLEQFESNENRLPDTKSRDQKSQEPRLRDPVNFARNVERFKPMIAKYIRFEVFATDSNSFREPCLDELEIFSSGKSPINVALQSNGGKPTSSGNYGNGTGIHQLPHLNDGRVGNSYSWISNEKGKGWVQIELAKPTLIDKVVWGRDRLGKFKDRLPVNYQVRCSTDGIQWKMVASSGDRAPLGSPHDPTLTYQRLAGAKSGKQFKSLAERLKKLQMQRLELEKKKLVYAGKFRAPDQSFVLRRGNPELKGDPVIAAVPSLFANQIEISNRKNEQARRLALAEWIASASNPLTARVIVNRIWCFHFGRGLVETPSDFGVNAARPTHPDLLDWLAKDFVDNGWSLKRLHRQIVTSQTYRQQATVLEIAKAKDATNRFYWHFPTRRLEAEAIRDSILAITGELNTKMGGPGFNFFKTRGGLSGFPEVTEFGPEQLRRMIYAHKIRMERVPVFGAFDCPDAGQATPLRSRSTTAVQALNLFNSLFISDRANRLAKRIENETSSDHPQKLVHRCFELVLGRPPSKIESLKSCELISKHGLPSLCRVLFNSNEFLFIP